mmetsp:Transcript_38796/g.70460  ORF Transcript_38796/g.70460 Transcript_38796/m.70460 type:complete len:201 (-) Transcript_38796:570-1172(-)
MIHEIEAEPLVRIEHHCRRHLRGGEELLEVGFNGQVHPHPLHLCTSVGQVGGEPLGQACQHVGLSLREISVLEVNDAKTLSLEAHIIARLHSELRYLLHEPRLRFLDGLLLAACSSGHFVAHAGLGMEVDPLLERQEVHVSLVRLLNSGLATSLHDDGRKLSDLKPLHDVFLLLRNEAKLHSSLEHGLTGQSLPDAGRRL